MSLVGSLRGVQAYPEPCNSNSNSKSRASTTGCQISTNNSGCGHSHDVREKANPKQVRHRSKGRSAFKPKQVQQTVHTSMQGNYLYAQHNACVLAWQVHYQPPTLNSGFALSSHQVLSRMASSGK